MANDKYFEANGWVRQADGSWRHPVMPNVTWRDPPQSNQPRRATHGVFARWLRAIIASVRRG